MKESSKKEIAFERTLFFSDAVVAIAITLLALDLKVEIPEGQHLSFKDLLTPWEKYLAFILSFINIAGFWRAHHDFFLYIKKMDQRIMFVNTCWLFFIITLPFATTLLSTHFGDTPAIFLYSLNIFLISVCQNSIWDYSNSKEDFTDIQKMNEQDNRNLRIMLNLDMINGLIAMGVSFWYPKAAFFLLFFKLPLFVIGTFYIAGIKRKEIANKRIKP